jgi:alpha-tubulin suppressor-like RCC1 family protein
MNLRLRRAVPARSVAWTAVSAWALMAAVACSNPTAPDPVPDEPDPFPDARSVRLWVYATGLVLQQADTVRQGFWVDEPDVSYEVYRCPAHAGYTCSTEFRSAWWSSDPRVLTVDSIGLITAVGPGEAVVWLQVESERDSALVRVVSNTGDAGARLTRIAAGRDHTCGLDEGGAAYCWGSDFYASLGQGTTRWFTRAGAPGPVAGGLVFAQLAAGGRHACGLRGSGEAWCWGKNFNGQIGNGLLDMNRPLAYEAGVPEPVQVVGELQFDTLQASSEATCGLAGGDAFCWGSNFNGELGIGSPDPQDDRAEPTPVTGGLTFRLLAGGHQHFCGVTTSDETYCWGEHNRAVPSGPGRLSNEPVVVAGAPSLMALVGGLGYSCGLTAARDTYCWGYNNRGQLGNDDLDGSEAPTLLAGGFEFVSLAAGARHTCGLTADGEAYCWGENEYGQLGNGERNFEPNPDPRRVAGFYSFESLTAGYGHTCGFTSDGVPLCWGFMSSGQLGNGRVHQVLPPFGAGHAYRPSPQRVVAPMG